MWKSAASAKTAPAQRRAACRRFIDACERKELFSVKALEEGIALGFHLKMPADVDADTPALGRACMGGNAKAARLLVNAGADIEARSGNGGTALFWACNSSQVECVEFLLGLGAKLSAVAEGDAPIHRASAQGSLGCVIKLLAFGDNPSRRNRLGMGPLSMGACGRATPAILKALIKAGADIEERDRRGTTPLAHALAGGNLAGVKLLLSLGADMEAKDSKGRTPRVIAREAAKEGHLIWDPAALLSQEAVRREALAITAVVRQAPKGARRVRL